MRGPYSLTSLQIDANVSSQAGAYVLVNGHNVAIYVGRADTDLNVRLRAHLLENETNLCIRRSGIVSFYFENANSAAEAYILECDWYHRFRPTCNIAHPAKNFSTWLCPVCGL